MKKGFMYLIIRWSWGKIAIICDSLGIPYTHQKTLFFSNIKTFFLSFDCHDHFDRNRLGPRINFASETGVKVVPFGGR